MTRRPKWVARTEEAIDEQTAPAPGERKYVTGADAHTSDREVLRREQRDEIAESWYGLGFLTDAQLKGALIGALVGGVIGAIVSLPLGIVAFGDLSIWWRLLIVALCGALAGSTALALYFGGREPELEGETQDVDDSPSIGTSMRDPHTDDRGR